MDCGKTYIPEYGDTEPCNPTSTDCVVHEQAIALLSLEENATVSEVISAMLLYIQTLKIRQDSLEDRIETLETT